MIEEHAEDEATLYVMGLLSPEEREKFEKAMATNPDLVALVGRLETGAAAMAWTTPPRIPPPELRERIMDKIEREKDELARIVTPFPSPTVWLPWAIAACLAVVAGCLAYQRYELKLLVDSFILRDRMQQGELDHVQARQAALQRHLDVAAANLAATGKQKADLQAKLDFMRGEVADLKARDELSRIKIATLASLVKNNPQAMAVVAWDPTAQKGILKTSGMPAAGLDKDYQLWIIDPDYKQPVSAGVFDPGKGGGFVPVQPISKADKFAISLEKKGGSPAPQGPILLIGE